MSKKKLKKKLAKTKKRLAKAKTKIAALEAHTTFQDLTISGPSDASTRSDGM